ncbi:MAG: endonuclease [Candidatus Portnoybacteria bacterium CG_4_8_14_3_um_filter_40_10]|uniref:Endonuclease n=4 Tax=Candidatus Portnoyibacteriota TaxID=1817913 RepID=A0A2M7II71_9BACT|nr:MAG: endonuclease [Candidatus Portnoybacteria bacterium CG11_big_fil_rev_8_21_14_0_20_40_15]PIS31731.1 MAG: endonuclease [Candidatus Portnoybacteria bacterium CG08_land_8_20_14_0_20_40_83]PIW76223.1 MAG: endonuclease [Candidatus Portnoybacteria bacterium CG_4_8_14_3_um_filter_40_10]PIY74654.1 MAG: endonuclease [Candidatus Portnoybacteria bacterium CG_4_10_14_0_8_um_filter_40_50]PJA64467.1 MAG: endonuclease [Candidatus Portnoybacteria bacterium CG_4_9_14_3_um_filter_40_10]
MPALNNSKRNIAEYITGYVDGEGCFSISFSKRKKLLIGWETKPSFAVGQNYDRSEVINLLKQYFDCGNIRRDYSDKTLKYEVRGINDLIKKVIPHFKKYPLLSGKKKDFESFAKICEMISRRKHLEKVGLAKIVRLAYQMNQSGKRKYQQNEIQKELL